MYKLGNNPINKKIICIKFIYFKYLNIIYYFIDMVLLKKNSRAKPKKSSLDEPAKALI
jgi:hypothetical protein